MSEDTAASDDWQGNQLEQMTNVKVNVIKQTQRNEC